MSKLTFAILAISLILPTCGFAVPSTAAQTQLQTSRKLDRSAIALTKKTCSARRYSRPHYRR